MTIVHVRRFATLFAVVLLATAGWILADSWAYPPEVKIKSFEFGKSKLVLEIDGTRDQSFPPHTLLIFLDDQLMAKYRNVGFTDVYASDDKRYFVGLSNSGIPGTAFVIFDAEGNLIREEKHRFLPRGIHTEMSVTVLRAWYDEKKPTAEFVMDNGRLMGVLVQGSNGQRYDLLKGDLGFKPSR